MAKTIMVQGTMSNVGKSIVTAGLCRMFKQDGYSVAPFKSQNMSSNAFTLPDGLRMSRAQAIQAEACGIEPSALMNPVLLIPESNTGAEVIVNGKSRGNMNAMSYFSVKNTLTHEIKSSFDALASEFDIIVIEGAGSPAEINLKENDIVNMGLARLVGAPVILVGDINPGGVFAQLYGTVMLLDETEREFIKGIVINKFRGDIGLLRPGLPLLEEKCGVPCLGVLPYLDADFEPEDSLSETHGNAAQMTADERYDLLADAVRNSLDMRAIYNILEAGQQV